MRWRPWCKGLVGARMPVQSGRRLALDRAGRAKAAAPTTASWSSCSSCCRGARGPGRSTAGRSDQVRRAPPWDCGYPDASPATQYTASSFAQPIRRVFGAVVFRAREHVDMPPPGALEPARLTVDMRDLVWDSLYAPVAGGVSFAADRLNHLQFLTIRQFLSPGLRRARAPAAGTCDIALILDLVVTGLQMLLVLRWHRCSPAFVRKVKARLLLRRGRP